MFAHHRPAGWPAGHRFASPAPPCRAYIEDRDTGGRVELVLVQGYAGGDSRPDCQTWHAFGPAFDPLPRNFAGVIEPLAAGVFIVFEIMHRNGESFHRFVPFYPLRHTDN